MGELILSTIVLSMDDKKIGLQIKKARLDSGLSQEDLAKHLNLTWEMISRYENGRSSAVKHIPKLAQIMDKPISYFIEKEKTNTDSFSIKDIVNQLKEEGVSYGQNYKNVVKLIERISGNGLEDDKNNSNVFIETTAQLTTKYPDLFAIKLTAIDKGTKKINSLENLPKNTVGFFSLNKEPEKGSIVITYDGITYQLSEYNPEDLAAHLAVLVKFEVEF